LGSPWYEPEGILRLVGNLGKFEELELPDDEVLEEAIYSFQ